MSGRQPIISSITYKNQAPNSVFATDPYAHMHPPLTAPAPRSRKSFANRGLRERFSPPPAPDRPPTNPGPSTPYLPFLPFANPGRPFPKPPVCENTPERPLQLLDSNEPLITHHGENPQTCPSPAARWRIAKLISSRPSPHPL